MASFSTAVIGNLLRPYLPDPSPDLLECLSLYLDLLIKWNERTNLTAVREPERIVTQHFGESLFVGRLLPAGANLLDLGSGAGFPGIPIQLLNPGLAVTLAEAQNKKAAFLREVVHRLGLHCEVWDKRVEEMPNDRRFDMVAWRAVDRAEAALNVARMRVASQGRLMCVRSGVGPSGENIAIPGNRGRYVNSFQP